MTDEFLFINPYFCVSARHRRPNDISGYRRSDKKYIIRKKRRNKETKKVKEEDKEEERKKERKQERKKERMQGCRDADRGADRQADRQAGRQEIIPIRYTWTA